MLCQGRIVWVAVSDRAGRNPKCRPAVIITPTAEIQAEGDIVVVAATGTFSKPLPANHVELPWKNGGHPVTKLYKPCVVVCDWVCLVRVADVKSFGGMVPKPLLEKILLRIPSDT
jgi:mRNA-degrading endonuclease toxin of MazEF toxin-antitoxin module